MKIRGIGRIKSLVETFKIKFQNKAIILAYHRVFTPEQDPQLLCVTPENFESHLKIISEFYNPISLQELGRNIAAGKIQNKSIVLTFDDGYIDNFSFAMPILEKYKVPATIFVTTDYIDKNKELWWDELEQIFLSQENSWDVTQKPLNLQQKYYVELHKKLKSLSFKERENILKQLASKQNVQIVPRKNYRIVNSNELKKLSQSKFIEIGSHTVSHSQLSAQKPEKQVFQVTESKKQLENIIPKLVTSFSYPFGTLNDIGPLFPSLLEKNDYNLATANFTGIVTKYTNRFMLPRYIVRNWDKKTFYDNIKKWFN